MTRLTTPIRLATWLVLLCLPILAAAQPVVSTEVPAHELKVRLVEPGLAAVTCETHLVEALKLEHGDISFSMGAADDALDSLLARFHDVHTSVRPADLNGAATTANFEVTYNGFSPEAKAAFQTAVDIWSVLIASSVPIRITANWKSLSPNVLGNAGPPQIHGNFGAGVEDTWYAPALANALAGEDLSPSTVDVVANFNSDFDNWYLGTDGQTPAGQFDFVSVVLHEIGHGLGFFGSMTVDDGSGNAECGGVAGEGCWGFDGYPGIPVIYDRFARNASDNGLIDAEHFTSPSAELGSALRSGEISFDGSTAAVANGGFVTPLYAPSTWRTGSSYSHLDEASFLPGHLSSLMTPFLNTAESIHDPGPVGCGVFADMGWSVTELCGSGTALPLPPGIPLLSQPVDEASELPRSVTLHWITVASAEHYRIVLGDDADFVSPILDVDEVADTSYALPELAPGMTYFWRVRAANVEGTSGWSSTFSFSTASAPPDVAPVLAGPPDGSEDLPTSLELSWVAVETAASYQVEVDGTADFSSPEFVFDEVAGLAVTLSDLEHATTYHWRVRAVNGGGDGPWSDAVSFTTIVAPPASAPILVTPAEAAAGVPVDLKFEWAEVPDASGYDLQLATNPDFSPIVLSRSNLVPNNLSIAKLQHATTYYWRVRASNVGGNGPWSEGGSFATVVAPPAVVTLVSPVDESSGLPVDLVVSWLAAAETASYDVQVSTTDGFEAPVVDRREVVETELELPGLDVGTEYRWRVRAVNAGGEGGWSLVFRFTTIDAPPTDVVLSSPTDASAGLQTSLTLSWHAVGGAKRYEVSLGEDSAFDTPFFHETALADTSVEVSGLEFGTRYFWRVRGVGAGGTGEWSPVFAFTTVVAPPAEVVLVAPVDAAADVAVDVMISWSEADGAEAYDVQVSNELDEPVVEREAIIETVLLLTGLEHGTLYNWRVRSVNAGGVGVWSAPFSFTTILPPPPAVTLSSPSDDSTGVLTRHVLRWRSARDAEAYEVVLADNPTFEPVLFYEAAQADTSVEVTGMIYSTRYYWRVRAVGAGGTGEWSDVFRFTTAVGTSSEKGADGVPERFALHQNYPNPFNPSTVVAFDLPKNADVTLQVFDVQGRLIATPVASRLAAGRHEVRWEAGDLPSGLYLCRITAGGGEFTATIRVMLLR